MSNSALKRRRSLTAVVCAAVAAVALLAGCGGSDEEASSGGGSAPAAAEADKKTVKIGLIQEDRAAASPWAAAMHDAAVKLEKEDGAIEFKEAYDAFDPTAAEPVARQFLTGGYDVLVLHSFALADVAKKLAKEFPDKLVSVSSFEPPQPPNLSIETSSFLQIGYANCWLLAKLSKTGTIGYLNGQPIPFATELLEGCKLGAKAADPKVKVLSGYTNSFTDQQATMEKGKAMVSQGADGLFPATATQDSPGAYQLCEQRKLNCVGWAGDARQWAPNTAVTSVIIDWSVLLKDQVAAVRDGKARAETFDATFENEGLVTPPFEGAPGERVPAEVQEEFAAMTADLASGAIELPKSKAHPCCP